MEHVKRGIGILITVLKGALEEEKRWGMKRMKMKMIDDINKKGYKIKGMGMEQKQLKITVVLPIGIKTMEDK